MPPSAPPPATHVRHARVAVSTLFFLNAVLYANLVPRLPEVKEKLGIGNAELGSAIAAMPLGSLLAGLLAPVLIRRWGSAKVADLGLVGLAASVAALALAPSWLVFAGFMLVVGALDAIVDVAQNAHALRVQRAYGRSILNAMHGLWSVGAVAGGLLGSAAAGLDIPLGLHLFGSAVVFSLVALVDLRFLLPGPEDAERVEADHDHAASRPARLRGVARGTLVLLAILGALAACESFVQDAGSSWSAIFMREEIGTGAAVGGLAFVSLQVAMTIARLVGDRVVDRFGQRRVVRVGGAVTAAGMSLALAYPSVGTAIVGFGLAGLGVATLVPAAMHTADELPGLPHGIGLTVVSWLLRVGFLVSPAIIGLLADVTNLRLALGTVVVAGLVVVVLGRVLLPTANGHHDPTDPIPGTAGGPLPER